MNFRQLASSFKEHPDLLNIDAEYAINLKILLENDSFKGFVKSQAAVINGGRRIELSSDIDSISSSSPTNSSKENVPFSNCESIPFEKSLPAIDLNVIPEEISISDSTFNDRNAISFEQDPVRTYHTDLFSSKKDQNGVVVVCKTLPPSNQVSRSVSLGKRNLSARIQSLMENFESNGRHYYDSSVYSSPESRRSNEKGMTKFGSPDAFSDPKTTADSCFVCNKTVYPHNRFSTGSHVYHKFCLKCNVCDRNLSPSTCEYSKDELFCRSHFLEKAHGLFRRASNPVSLPTPDQQHAQPPLPPQIITVECKT